jgi:hypothetical protein
MKRLLIAFLLLLSALPARAEDPAWQVFESKELGFRFSYPQNWFLYTGVRTAYIAQGLAPALTVCITPGPVKTLSCAEEIYAIPLDKFTAPAAGKFLGLPEESMDNFDLETHGEFKQPPFFVAVSPDGGKRGEGWTNRTISNNGYIYLWAHSGTAEGADTTRRMLASLHTFAPVKTCMADTDCAGFCKAAAAGKDCLPNAAGACSKGQCRCLLTCR